MQAPEQPYLMPEIMINKVTQFPNDIAINKPIPGESGFEQGVLFKKTDTKNN